MRTRFAAGIALLVLLISPPLLAQQPPFATQPPAEKLDELPLIVVYGGYATPQMWEVSKGDHVMWVLGDTTAPAGAQWRFEQVEAHLTESQLLMYPGHVAIGFFKVIGALTLMPSILKVEKNPDNKTLKDVLPPEVYERWHVLKTTYAPRDNDLERLRPSIAMEKLDGIVREKLGEKNVSAQPKPPPPGPWLRPLVDKAAKKHNVKIRTTPNVETKLELKNMREALKFIAASSLVDVKCVTQKLGSIERWIEYMTQAAAGTAQGKAPARGPYCDETNLLIEKLRSGEIPDTAGILKIMDNVDLQQKLSNQQLDAEWIGAAEAALAMNKSTFAVLQIRNVKGYIAKFRELGYEVEEPGGGVK